MQSNESSSSFNINVTCRRPPKGRAARFFWALAQVAPVAAQRQRLLDKWRQADAAALRRTREIAAAGGVLVASLAREPNEGSMRDRYKAEHRFSQRLALMLDDFPGCEAVDVGHHVNLYQHDPWR